MKFKLLFVLVLLTASCAKAVTVKNPPLMTSPCNRFGYDNDAQALFPYTVEDCAVVQSEWDRAQRTYASGRIGLLPADAAKVAGLNLTDVIVTKQRPEKLRIADDGYAEPTIPYPGGGFVQAFFNYNGVLGPTISYGNPYALHCEFYHLFEFLTHPENVPVWSEIGHCTANDPMAQCCWKLTRPE